MPPTYLTQLTCPPYAKTTSMRAAAAAAGGVWRATRAVGTLVAGSTGSRASATTTAPAATAIPATPAHAQAAKSSRCWSWARGRTMAEARRPAVARVRRDGNRAVNASTHVSANTGGSTRMTEYTVK